MAEREGGPTVLHLARQEECRQLYIYDATPNFVCACDLDFLLNMRSLWEMPPEALDQAFVTPGFKKPLFFQWLSTSKDRARFSRKPYSNTTTDLTLFAGQVHVGETTIDFQNGKVSAVSITVWDRADLAKDPASAGYADKAFDLCYAGLNAVLKVSHRTQSLNRVRWTQNDSSSVELERSAVFVRIRLTPSITRDWNYGRAIPAQKNIKYEPPFLYKNVKYAANGDIYIHGIPMVDQGLKGYCLLAACQRLFEYFNMPIDEHDMALLTNTKAEGGTSPEAMRQALSKMTLSTRLSKFRLKSIWSKKYEKNEAELDIDLVRKYVDVGIPLLWGLYLGYPEDPPLSAKLQIIPPLRSERARMARGTSGANNLNHHSRVIIGYNLTKNQILFSDSWGAGHELKRMSTRDAANATSSLYVIEPVN